MWNVECGMWNVECGMWNVECGMWNVECGTWNVECGMLNAAMREFYTPTDRIEEHRRETPLVFVTNLTRLGEAPLTNGK